MLGLMTLGLEKERKKACTNSLNIEPFLSFHYYGGGRRCGRSSQ